MNIFRRFANACSAFLWAWKHFDPVYDEWYRSTEGLPHQFSGWMKNRMEFKIEDLCALKSGTATRSYGIEPFMLKKQCIDREGRVRYFDVVPEGYERVEH